MTTPIRKALRLRLTWRGDAITLDRVLPVAMTVIPGDSLKQEGARAGFWFEIQNAERRTLYRRILHPPHMYDVEVAGDDKRGSMVMVPLKQPRTVTLELIAPDLPDGRWIVLFSSPLEPARVGEAAREVARFALQESA